MNNFTNNTKKYYKYKREKLDCDSAEHKFVKGFFDKTIEKSCYKT